MTKFIRSICALLVTVAIIGTVAAVVVVRTYPFDYYDTVAAECGEYDLDPLFILSLIKAESNFKPDITSQKGAMGLMQVTPETAEWCADKMNLTDFTFDMLYTPEVNIKIGVWYINYLLDSYDGNYNTAVAAYNAGIGNVNGWLQNEKYTLDGENLIHIPFGETNRYVAKVMNYYKIYTYINQYKGVALNES